MKFTLHVNGVERVVDVPRRTTILSVLRDDLGLTGSRYGCGAGQCGACFVLADGDAVASCLMSVEDAANHDITTIEGLHHPVQDAFAAEDAMQCGYCTSGMLIAAAALLQKNPRPDEVEIRDAMAGNLCRCGVYGRAIRAIQKAAEVNP